jgi:hypothetical protein
MTIRQLSVFLENKTGYLNQVLNVLARNQINIVALTVADTSDYGIMRAIVSNPEKALEALRAEQFTVRVHAILGLEMDAARVQCRTYSIFLLQPIFVSNMYMLSVSEANRCLFSVPTTKKKPSR